METLPIALVTKGADACNQLVHGAKLLDSTGAQQHALAQLTALRNTGVMRVLACSLLAAFVAGCSSHETPPPDAAAKALAQSDELAQLDKSMSQLSARNGIGAAFAAMFDVDAVSLHSGSTPLNGRDAIVAATMRCGDACSLTWEPVHAEADGSLGYTWGTYLWTRTNGNEPPQRQTGSYVTVWKKTATGDWKAVLDTGTTDE